MAAWSVTPDGLAIAIRLTPRGGRDSLDGIETLADGRQVLKAWVRAAPSEGEANAALIALLAKELQTSRSQMTLTAGAGARLKRIVVRGDAEALAAQLQRQLC
ncbi:hypothetical protein SAMN05428997_10781 [Bosea sp. CRIB-10]|uniref:DUF167 family protein n=1 Tax=Bosea sp. CRIB-10 TaxID=378404 RepID=UPI0008F26192|nr:DUF167 family protein [Bosea sp. CRIB-10]SFC47558.1 hypothetical protein SAMN05428997_10781 [Bosea sp. CRIB-10]